MVWFDSRDGRPDIYGKHSFDGGVSWSEDLRLTTSGMAVLPSIARSGEALHVVWRDMRSGINQIYYLRIPASSRRRAVAP